MTDYIDINFRSFPPSGGMFIMAQTTDGRVHYSPCLADHVSARAAFVATITNGGVVCANWIDQSRGQPVEIAAYAQTGLFPRDSWWVEVLEHAKQKQAERRGQLNANGFVGSDADAILEKEASRGQ